MNSKDKIVLMIHIDALRYDYITEKDAPFLTSLGRDGFYSRLVPPFGFEPDVAYWSGLQPGLYEGAVHFIFEPQEPLMHLPEYLSRVLDYLNIYFQYPIRKGIERVIKSRTIHKWVKAHATIAAVPFCLIKFFNYSTISFPYERNYCKGHPTIFSMLNKAGNKSSYLGSMEFNLLLEKLRNIDKDTDFIFIMINELDDVGHKYGPDSTERRLIMNVVDEKIKMINEVLAELGKPIDMIVFGDHGMVPVHTTVDIESILRKTGLRKGYDYTCFLDSTMARFWFFKYEAQRKIVRALESLGCGSWMDDKEMANYGILEVKRKLGEAIFWLHGGYMIFPNYWQRRRSKLGMHGYRREVLENHSLLIYRGWDGFNGRKAPQTVTMQDIFTTTVTALNLPIV